MSYNAKKEKTKTITEANETLAHEKKISERWRNYQVRLMVEPMSIYKSCPPRIVVTGSVLRTERICRFVTAYTHTMVNKNKNENEGEEERKKNTHPHQTKPRKHPNQRVKNCFSGKRSNETVRERHKRNTKKKFISHAEWKKTHLTRTTGKQQILSSFYNENKAFTLLFFSSKEFFFHPLSLQLFSSRSCVFFCQHSACFRFAKATLFFPTSLLNTYAE